MKCCNIASLKVETTLILSRGRESDINGDPSYCGVRHGMLPRASGITNAREHSSGVRRSVRGNGGCFNLELWSLCVWRRWVRTSLRSDRVSKTVCGRESAPRVAVSRPGDWRYWERRCQELRTTWSATKWCCVRPVNSELRPVWAGVVCVC